MCGIFGILGREGVTSHIVGALRRLEYRGYDSAGIATVANGSLRCCRAAGKLVNLEAKLAQVPLPGASGIGHTRWATHGRPNEINAHPHATSRVAVAHNGIIENFNELRQELESKGVEFGTETDTEVVAHLVTAEMTRGCTAVDAVRAALPRLRGTFALAFVFAGEEDLMIGARRGSPLAIGHGQGEMYLGSDALALVSLTNAVTYLADGDLAVLRRSGAEIYDAMGRPASRPITVLTESAFCVDKGGHRHFMSKEIHEQPEVIAHTLSHYLDMASNRVVLPTDYPFGLATIERIYMSACGTACYAAQVARYWFERYARLPVEVDIASEFRYRESPLASNALALFVSQSGETADTLASLRYARQQGNRALSVVNVAGSTIARESDVVLPTLAGAEVGVASTKAFTCQLAVLACLAIATGRARRVLSRDDEIELVRSLIEVPGYVSMALSREAEIERLAQSLSGRRDVLFMGRGTSYPIALEAALKLKEVTYIHAEGYAAGELKHGPIALIDENVPVIVVAPHDSLFEKTVSNMQEVAARGGRIILLTDARGAREIRIPGLVSVEMPETPPLASPFVYALPAQLLAYHAAVHLGADVDQPRNLAKSVTVE